MHRQTRYIVVICHRRPLLLLRRLTSVACLAHGRRSVSAMFSERRHEQTLIVSYELLSLLSLPLSEGPFTFVATK